MPTMEETPKTCGKSSKRHSVCIQFTYKQNIMEIKPSGGDISWKINKAQSHVKFKVRHLLTYISGVFKNFDINVITLGENFSTAQISITVDLLSVDTGNTVYNNAIVNSDLLKNGNSYSLGFISGRLEKASEHHFRVFGNLSLFDTTKTEILDMKFEGLTRTPGDKVSASFLLEGKIKYMDFITGKEKPKLTSLFLSHEAELHIFISLDKP
jgi:polyisoprenoid-binding protein YceI